MQVQAQGHCWWTEARWQDDICEFLRHILAYMQPILRGRGKPADMLQLGVQHSFSTLPPLLDQSKDRNRTVCFLAPPSAIFLQVIRFS